MRQIAVQTDQNRQMVDVTAQVRLAVQEHGVAEGICLVFSPHTTAAITTNENWDPDVQADMLRAFADMLGDERRFKHAEGNSGAHALTSLVGPSLAFPVSGGSLVLGQWQGVYLCEFDGPRQRTVIVQVIGG